MKPFSQLLRLSLALWSCLMTGQQLLSIDSPIHQQSKYILSRVQVQTHKLASITPSCSLKRHLLTQTFTQSLRNRSIVRPIRSSLSVYPPFQRTRRLDRRPLWGIDIGFGSKRTHQALCRRKYTLLEPHQSHKAIQSLNLSLRCQKTLYLKSL